MRPNRSEEVIEVAYKLFSQKGYDATSIRDICQASNLTTAGLYHYVKTKEELFNRVEEDLYKDFSALFEKPEFQKDIKGNLKQLIRDYCKLILSHRGVTTIILEKVVSEGTGAYTNESKKRKREFVRNLKQKLGHVEKLGMADKDIDITVATFILIAAVNWLSLWYNPSGKIKEDQLIDSISKFFIKGFFKNE